MSTGTEAASPRTGDALDTLLALARAAREAGSEREIAFLLVNDTHALTPYRQAALWLAEEGVHTLSGVLLPEANAPYVQWLDAARRELAARDVQTLAFTAADLPPPLAEAWADWWPAHALWLRTAQGGLLFVREQPWDEASQALLREWVDTAWHAMRALRPARVRSLRGAWHSLRAHVAPAPGQAWWRQNRWRWLAAAALVLAIPVRLTVLAPGELVPAHPMVVRAPLDGVIDVFHVQPNQVVKKDQPLFGFDEALIESKLQVAEQGMATAETEYRQATQQALLDAKARTQLALLTGRIEEKRAEVAWLREQRQRARVLAPGEGVALFDDPSEWIGKPVNVGERILRIAAPSDVEVEAWLPLADAVQLAPGSEVSLYLNASPLSPVQARMRYMAHDAVQRPDGSYAYRVRAALEGSTRHRVGLKGTARVQGGRVPLAYWMLRRPLAWLRTTLGV